MTDVVFTVTTVFSDKDIAAATVIQPTKPNFIITILCATSYDCSNSFVTGNNGTPEGFIYMITETSSVIIPACISSHPNCSNTSSLAVSGSQNLTVLKNSDNTFKITIATSNTVLTDTTVSYTLTYSDTAPGSTVTIT